MGSSLMGSVSADSDPKTQKLIDIMDGGENFIARMKALQDQEKSAKEADAKLRTSQDMRGTLDAAAERLAKAEKALVEARAKATEIMTQAREYAQHATAEAQNRVKEAEAQLREFRGAAERAVTDAQRTRDEAAAQAKAVRDEAAAVHADAKEKEHRVARAREELAADRKGVEELRHELQSKLRALTEAMARAGA